MNDPEIGDVCQPQRVTEVVDLCSSPDQSSTISMAYEVDSELLSVQPKKVCHSDEHRGNGMAMTTFSPFRSGQDAYDENNKKRIEATNPKATKIAKYQGNHTRQVVSFCIPSNDSESEKHVDSSNSENQPYQNKGKKVVKKQFKNSKLVTKRVQHLRLFKTFGRNLVKVYFQKK